MLTFLSPEWIEAFGCAAAGDRELQAAASGRTVGFTVVVIETDGDDVVYHVSVHDGRLDVGRGPAQPEDLRLTQRRATADAVARGAVNAQEAFISGEIELTGDLNALLDHLPLLLAFDRAGATVRSHTCYGS